MRPRSGEALVQVSVLDRLLGVGEHTGDEGELWRGLPLEKYRELLRRDLEWLLTTRRVIEPAGDEHPELQRSVYEYGLPDMTAVSGDSVATRRNFMRKVEQAIQRFEPRIQNVRVTAVEQQGDNARQLRFVIEGDLQVEGVPERVAFDTTLEPSSGKFTVIADS